MKVKNPKIEKAALLENSERYKENFAEDLSEMTSKIERGIITGLIVGGLAYVTYLFVKGLTSDSDQTDNQKPEDHQKPGNAFGHVAKYVAEAATLLLINLAKEKLIEYLSERKQVEDDNQPDN
jgi:hypothetical protein